MHANRHTIDDRLLVHASIPLNVDRPRTTIGPKPVEYIVQGDPPAEGDAAVFDIRNAQTSERIAAASTLLGPGRDYMDMDDARTGLINIDTISSTLHGPYSTITALLVDFPDAKLDGTAKRLLAHEQARESYRVAVAEWEAAMVAAGLEPCDRCGGVGGWKGWPGYTCYECGGRGSVTPA